MKSIILDSVLDLILSFFFLLFLFFEVYFLSNYFIFKVESKYPLKSILNLLFLLSINSYFFTEKIDLIKIILIIFILLYLLTLRFNVNCSKLLDYFFSFVLFIPVIFYKDFYLCILLFFYLFLLYKKDIDFMRGRPVDFSIRKDLLTCLNDLEKNEFILKNRKNKNVLLELMEILVGKKELIRALLYFQYRKQFFFTDKRNVLLLKELNDKKINQEIEDYMQREFIYSFFEEDYIIKKEDYERINEIETYFNHNYKFKILEIFNNKSVISGENKRLEFDHSFIPKSLGGNFILMHRKGYLLFNVVLLTKEENIEKSDLYGYNFFSEDEIDTILRKLKKMNILLNKDEKLLKLFYDRNTK